MSKDVHSIREDWVMNNGVNNSLEQGDQAFQDVDDITGNSQR